MSFIARLQRAREIDPKMVEPTASYIAGLALENQGDRTQAREAMERVIATDPGGPWGGAARTRLDRWALTPYRRNRDYWAELTVGVPPDEPDARAEAADSGERLGRHRPGEHVSSDHDRGLVGDFG